MKSDDYYKWLCFFYELYWVENKNLFIRKIKKVKIKKEELSIFEKKPSTSYKLEKNLKDLR